MSAAKQVIIQQDIDGQRVVLEETGNKRVALTPGLYCIWDETAGDFLVFNATPEELAEFFMSEAKNDITRKVKAVCHELQCGEQPYAQYTKTFAEAVTRGQHFHGEDHYEFEDVPEETTE